MKVIKPSIEVEEFDSDLMLKKIEKAGRTCYKSEANITTDSSKTFIKNIIRRGHESVLEHEKISVRIICDRGVSHELVRHRIASYSQESTRYVQYAEELEVIEPCFWEEDKYRSDMNRGKIWIDSMQVAENSYKALISAGASPQEARSVLPNSLKTEVVATMNLRSWRHFLKLRCARASHPQMREIAFMILKEFNNKLPVIFNDINEEFNDGS